MAWHGWHGMDDDGSGLLRAHGSGIVLWANQLVQWLCGLYSRVASHSFMNPLFIIPITQQLGEAKEPY